MDDAGVGSVQKQRTIEYSNVWSAYERFSWRMDDLQSGSHVNIHGSRWSDMSCSESPCIEDTSHI